MQPTRQQFLAATERWNKAMGNAAQKFWTYDREVARRAVAGEIAFRHIGVKFTPVGRKDIDWSAPHHHHQALDDGQAKTATAVFTGDTGVHLLKWSKKLR